MLIEQTVPADMAHLGVLLEAVDRICRMAGADRAFHADMKLAVEEALVNVIKHGHAGLPAGDMRLVLSVGPWEGHAAVRADIQDNGHPFNPLALAAPDITAKAEERPIGGLGIMLMRKVSDAQTYRHDVERGNQLTLVKFLPAATAA